MSSVFAGHSSADLCGRIPGSPEPGRFCGSTVLALSSLWAVYLQAIHQLIFVVGPLAPLYLGAFVGSTILALSIMGSVFAGHSSADLCCRTPGSPVPGRLLWQHSSDSLHQGSVFAAIHQLIFVVGPWLPCSVPGCLLLQHHAGLSIMGGVFAGHSSADLCCRTPGSPVPGRLPLQHRAGSLHHGRRICRPFIS
jgi:hypothetical protein